MSAKPPDRPGRRSYGTGRLFIRTDAGGQESWYGSWWAGSRRVKRKLGPKRLAGTSAGLTRRQAEAELRRRMQDSEAAPPAARATFRELAEQHIRRLEAAERKPTTLEDYRIILRLHLYPAFGDRPVDRITADSVSSYIALKRAGDGLSSNTVRNQLNLLHAVLARAVRAGQLARNPVEQIERPRARSGRERRLSFLQPTELDRLLNAVPDDALGAVERPLYLTATMTGLRQGELLALRWRDVDFKAARIRVADSFTRGRLGAPKSHAAIRSVPLAERVRSSLERHRRATSFSSDDDLAFAHPQSGHHLDASRVRKRFQRALARASLPDLRFHDLRHTFGTQMAAAGAPLRAIQEWMGHADPTTTAIYAHYAPDPTHGVDIVNRAFDR